ncbi:MAG: helix-turn-helix transcriptional regulator [Acidobacteria bacterium]|nr:helix-turn-helix transcriptional regulator [Acidobacteriota bacterium]
MVGAELGTVLAVLRIVRGWNQEELAQASGLRSGTISDYERGKMVPGLNTLQRLLGAMGYPLAALDQARAFVDCLRTERLPAAEAPGVTGGPAALRREVEQVSAEAGRVVSRLTRLMFAVMSSPASGEGGEGLHPGE